jgi:hypothetical protein
LINASHVSLKDLLNALIAMEPLHENSSLKFPIMLWSGAGIGKTEIVRQYAETVGRKCMEVHLVAHDAADLGGAPSFDYDNKRMINFIADMWPDAERDGDRGVLFLDEASLVDEATLKILYRLLLDGKVGNYILPPGWIIIAAGNRPEDVGEAHEFNPAVNDRLIHFVVRASTRAWIEYAKSIGVARVVYDFIETYEHMFLANAEDLSNGLIIQPSPRSWVRVSEVIKNVQNKNVLRNILPGMLGDKVYASFWQYFLAHNDLPKMKDLFMHPIEKIGDIFPKTREGIQAMSSAMAATVASNDNEKVFFKALRILNAYDEVQSPVPDMKELQAHALSMILEAGESQGFDPTRDAAFRSLDRKRSGDR